MTHHLSASTEPTRSRSFETLTIALGVALTIGLVASRTAAQGYEAPLGIVQPGSMVPLDAPPEEQLSIGDWGFEWWQWIFGITSPDPWSDTTGSSQHAGQMPPVFFTCGASGAAAAGPITRSFRVPADMYILASLSSTGAFYEPGIDPPTLCTVELPGFIDQTSSLSFSLDGAPIPQSDLFNFYREPSSLNLTSIIVPGNPYFPGKAGSYPGSCADGYYVMIEPLPSGPHTIECGFTHPIGAVLDHTNEFTVLEPLVDFLEVHVDGVSGDDGLNGANGVTVSPDNAHVYVASAFDGVGVFSRDPLSDGALTFVEAQQNNVGGVTGMTGAKAVDVSPDGAHVYVAAETSNAIAIFSRDPVSGALTFAGTQSSGGNPRSLVVSPDNRHLYVARLVGDAISVYARDTSSGLLTFVESQRDGFGGVDGLDNPWAVTISGDGAHVYSAAVIDDAVAVFARDETTGRLTFVERQRDGLAGVDGLNGANGVSVSPDGHHVYVTSNSDNSIAAFERDPGTGALTFVEVHKSGEFGLLLGYATWAAVSPDGNYVYVSSRNQDVMNVFRRDSATGSLTFLDLQRDNIDGVDGLDSPWTLAVSPDGLNIYAAAEIDDSVAVFLPEPSTTGLLLSGACFVLLLGQLSRIRRRSR